MLALYLSRTQDSSAVPIVMTGSRVHATKKSIGCLAVTILFVVGWGSIATGLERPILKFCAAARTACGNKPPATEHSLFRLRSDSLVNFATNALKTTATKAHVLSLLRRDRPGHSGRLALPALEAECAYPFCR